MDTRHAGFLLPSAQVAGSGKPKLLLTGTPLKSM
jgi:hypothetical protein